MQVLKFIRKRFSTMIYLIRHAESCYNAEQHQIQQKFAKNAEPGCLNYQQTQQYLKSKFDIERFEDVDITQKGIQQCKQCAQKLRANKINVDLVIVSPFRRALSTCHEIFSQYKKKNDSKFEIIVDPDFRQIFESSCDIGSRLRQSMKDYPYFDYTLIKNPEYWYLQAVQDKKIREKLLQKINQTPQKEQQNQAKMLILQQLKSIWKERTQDKQKEKQLMELMLPSIDIQKNKLKLITQKYKSIAIVTHSQNIKSYIGYKPNNCSIVQYKPQYLNLENGAEIPKSEL